MKSNKFILIALLAMVSQAAFAAKPVDPVQGSAPLRALWNPVPSTNTDMLGESCHHFFIVDNRETQFAIRRAAASEGIGFLVENIWFQASPVLSTFAEAQDWLIQLFIKVNGLDATLADVPLDDAGQRDCAAWNTQLITP